MFRRGDRDFENIVHGFGRLGGSNRSPPTPSDTTVYVIVKIDRFVLARGVVDNQADIEVIGVFMSREDADAHMALQGIGQRWVIHESVLYKDRTTFRPEIYS